MVIWFVNLTFVLFLQPAYTQLLQIPQHFPGVPVMALNATVTPDTLGRLQDVLPNSVLVKLSAKWPWGTPVVTFYNSKGGTIMKTDVCINLWLQVHIPETCLHNLIVTLMHILQVIRREPPIYLSARHCIIYVDFVEDVAWPFNFLNNSLNAGSFYGRGLSGHDKDQLLRSWRAGGIQVMVATEAFGLGTLMSQILKRLFGLEYLPPLEEFIQQFGQADRDGRAARGTSM